MAKTFDDLVNEAKTRIREISPGDVRAKLDGDAPCTVVDVREDVEWSQGHLPAAVHIGRGVLEMRAPKLVPDLDREVVLYCGGGYRSALAADALQVLGYTNVASMAGGFGAWVEAGFDVGTD